MNPESDEPMDTQLLQLERELFSLTPAEAPRDFSARLERQMQPTAALSRVTVDSSRIVPFRWRRMVVPAAAAVVVVSVLNRVDGPESALSRPGVSGLRTAAGNPTVFSSPATVERATGYVLKSEPVYTAPAAWDSLQHQYWISPDQLIDPHAPAQRPPTDLLPVSFH